MENTIGRALEVYDEVRRPFAQNVQELSFKVGQVVWLDSPSVHQYCAEESAAGRIPETVLRELVTKDLADHFRWTWETDPQIDVQLAIQKLKQTCRKIDISAML